jgi:hypothetical protein
LGYLAGRSRGTAVRAGGRAFRTGVQRMHGESVARTSESGQRSQHGTNPSQLLVENLILRGLEQILPKIRVRGRLLFAGIGRSTDRWWRVVPIARNRGDGRLSGERGRNHESLATTRAARFSAARVRWGLESLATVGT